MYIAHTLSCDKFTHILQNHYLMIDKVMRTKKNIEREREECGQKHKLKLDYWNSVWKGVTTKNIQIEKLWLQIGFAKCSLHHS